MSATLITTAILVVKSSLLLGVGFAATRVLHRAPAAVRHIAWLTAIVGVLLIPLFDRFTPVPLRVLPATPLLVAPSIVAPNAAAQAVDNSQPATTALAPSTNAIIPTSPKRTWSVAQIAFAMWSIGMLLLLARLVWGAAAVSRLTRRARRIESGAWIAALEQAAAQLGLQFTPRLVMSDEVEMAFTFDALTPTIVLPTGAEEWTPDRSRSVLLHELAHIRRHDLVGHAVAGIACALNWFNPVVWLAARQLRVESELASDEVVLRAGVRPSAYAQHLLDMVTSVSRRAPRVALAMARPKEFEGRLVAILEPMQRRAAFGGRELGGVAGLLAVSSISIGAIVPTARVQASVANTAPIIALEPRRAASPVEMRTSGGRGGAAVAGGPRVDAQSTLRGASSTPSRVAPEFSRLSAPAVSLLRRYGTSSVMNPMIMLLRQADSLHLTGAQADSIATLNRRYMVGLTGIWAPIAARYAEQSQNADLETGNNEAAASRETARALVGAIHSLDAILTPEQRERIPDNIKPYLDSATVQAIAAQSPTGVFVGEPQLVNMLGRGRRGG